MTSVVLLGHPSNNLQLRKALPRGLVPLPTGHPDWFTVTIRIEIWAGHRYACHILYWVDQLDDAVDVFLNEVPESSKSNLARVKISLTLRRLRWYSFRGHQRPDPKLPSVRCPTHGCPPYWYTRDRS